MTVLLTLAEFIQSERLAQPPLERLDRVNRHVIESVGAMLAGARLEEGLKLSTLIAPDAGSAVKGPGYSCCASLWSAVSAATAAARCTEIDDIHLASCTTPGSVVVPTALALASAGELQSWGEFCAAVSAGYELLIRLGYAIDGPAVLRKNLWPTYFAAAFGAGATACRAFRLTIPQTAGALATALASCAGTSISASSADSSRWLLLGAAAANGLLAANAARSGLIGPIDFVERHPGGIAGVPVSRERLLGGLHSAYFFDNVGMKPYPVARQALAAVEACRELVSAEHIDIENIDEIAVQVPEGQQWLINHPERPDSRMASIISVQYQIAIALLAPERLIDVHRTSPFGSDAELKLMQKVQVFRAADLERYYPEAWPARIEIKAGKRRVSHQVFYPRGDARNPFGWDDVQRKFHTIAGPILSTETADQLVSLVRDLTLKAPIPDLWGYLSRAVEAVKHNGSA